jgi:predicted ATPase
VTSHGGFIHKPRGEGDSQFAVFPGAANAVNAAVLIQQRFFVEPWTTPRPLKIRVALHTGEANLRLGDYYGPEVNRTARLRSIAHGGQVLLSDATRNLVRGELPDGVSVQDMGEHRLKDIARPEHVYQLIIKGLPYEFPPLKSQSLTLTNIPAQATPFIGREDELAILSALLADEERRLITLTGSGGMGKTRLAIEAAGQQTARFQDGVYFVALAPLSSRDEIVQAIVETASIAITSGDDMKTQLLRYLRRKEMLLILDNFEHLLDGAQLVNDVLEAAAGVTILATSREKLNLMGESVVVIGGLRVDDWQTLDEVLASSAGKLFVQGAQRAQVGFVMRDKDVHDVAHICRLMQGMPLAILLAASWADMLLPREIAAEIENSLDFLASELRDIPPRQRSIRAVFEGSWDKLTQSEQALFMRLSVFRGGFTREAAAETAEASLRSLSKLVNKSLLLRDPDSGRYEIHELLRQYAAERLEADPESANEVREKHAAYFRELLKDNLEPLRSSRQRDVLNEIEADIDNVRFAWAYLVEGGRAAELEGMVVPLWYVYELRCWYHGGLDLFAGAEAAFLESGNGEAIEAVVALLHSTVGFFESMLGAMDVGREMFLESLDTLQALDRRRESLMPLTGLYVCNLILNNVAEARQAALDVIETATELGDTWWEADGLGGLAAVYMWTGSFEEARLYAEKSVTMWEKIGDPWGPIWPTQILAGLEAMAGNYTAAKRRYQFVLETTLSMNFKRGVQFMYNDLGNVSFMLEDYGEAEAYYLRSLGISDEIGMTLELLASFYDLARVRAAMGREVEALEMLAIVIKNPAGTQRALYRQSSIEEDAETLRSELEDRLEPETYAAAWGRGMSRELQEAVDEVLGADGRQPSL